MKRNVLIIAPHSDDEILGCGGIMAKYQDLGIDVFVVIVTNGHLGAPELFKKEGTERVRAEALNAHQYLGVKKTIFLDFPAPRLDTIPSYQLSIKLEEIIRSHYITDLYIPHRGDIHKDHRITFEASLVSSRPIYDNPVKRIYTYETLSETEWAAPYADDVFIPNVFIEITDFIDKKIEAFKYFNSQIKKHPHPRSIESIEILSKLRGATISVRNAEAFMLIRSIENQL